MIALAHIELNDPFFGTLPRASDRLESRPVTPVSLFGASYVPPDVLQSAEWLLWTDMMRCLDDVEDLCLTVQDFPPVGETFTTLRRRGVKFFRALIVYFNFMTRIATAVGLDEDEPTEDLD